MKLMTSTLLALACPLLIIGCTTATEHQSELGADEESRLTVAAVQREVQVGMSGAAVLAALGSPNIVSTDSERREVWVYDRVGTEYVYSHSGTGLISLIGAASSAAAGGLLPSYQQGAGATRRSQRTLTIVVRFDAARQVRDFSYHASRF